MQKPVFYCSYNSKKIQEIHNTVGFKKWLEDNQQIDESFDFCVLKEWIMKCYLCEQNKIPFYFDDIPEDCISVFNVKQSGVNHKWNELMQKDIKRKIYSGTDRDCIDFAKQHKKVFVKSHNKPNPMLFVPHAIIDIRNPEMEIKNIYSQAMQNFDVRLVEDIIDWRKKGNTAEECIILSKLRKIPNPLLFCKFYDVKKERRFILKESKIISYSQAGLDYEINRDDATRNDINAMVEFVEYLAQKYHKEVPYKIWNIDVAFFNGTLDIVECHFNCQHLGHYLDNLKGFIEYF